MNAFTESLAAEVAQFGVRMHLALPGRAPDTRFGDNARPYMTGLDHAAYAALVKGFVASAGKAGPITRPQDVAEAVWRAVTDPANPIRIPAGADAEGWAAELG